MKRSGFRAKGWTPRPAKVIEYEPRPRPPARAEVATTPVRPVPKREYWRSLAYRAMARDKPCMLLVPGVCCGDWSTTVLAHSNRGADGKGGAIKATDERAAWCCFSCHSWLDQGAVSSEQKEAAWEAALARQVAALEAIAADMLARPAERELAAEALRRLSAPAP